MFVRSSIVVVLSVAAVVMASAVGDHHQHELKDHYDHLAYIADFPCHRPQPRVISVHHLFPEEEMLHKAFFPDVTVLHRCDNYAGCCTSNHHCHPKHSHHVQLPFKVTFLEHVGQHKKGSWIMEYHTFDNHTECACIETPIQHHEREHQGPALWNPAGSTIY